MNKIMIAAPVLIVGIAAGAYFTGLLDGLIGAETIEEGAEVAEVVVEEKPPIFYKVPKLTVSSNYNGRLRYLQISISILTRDENTVEKLQLNTPLIQNAMITLIGSFDFSELETNEGKEELRTKAEEEVMTIISDAEIESVLFTGFVIQ